MEVLQEEYPDLENGSERKDNTSVQIRSLHLEARDGTYSEKQGIACGVNLSSKKYPPSGDDFMVSPQSLSAFSMLKLDAYR